MLHHVLYSDLDGTLIGAGECISQENKQAIWRFTEAGGLFSVATGRITDITRPFIKDLPLSLPAVVYNGAAVYDFQKDTYLRQQFLPAEQVRAIVKVGLQACPDACIELCRGDSLALLNPDGKMDTYIEREKQAFYFSPNDNCEQCMKLMFWGEHGSLQPILQAVLEAGVTKGLSVFFSSPHYLEFLCEGVNKATAIAWVCETFGLPRARLATIGDFDNDVEMLSLASLSACPENGSEAARRAATMLVPANTDHSVAAFVDHLMAQPTAIAR